MFHRAMSMGAVLLAAALTANAAPAAGERATAPEAEAMVHKAVAFYKAKGREKALAEFNDRKGLFIDRDLYITAYQMDGTNVAQPINPKMVGKNLIDIRDIDGKPYVRERLELAQSKGSFWQDYSFVDPITRKVLPKQMFCERADELVLCGGIYKP